MWRDDLSDSDALRLERIVGAIRRDAPSAREVREALNRIGARAPRRAASPGRSVPGRSVAGTFSVALAASLATGGALAVGGVLRVPSTVEPVLASGVVTESGPKETVPQVPRIFKESAGQLVELPASGAVELKVSEHLTVSVGEVSTEISGPGLVRLGRRGEDGGWVAGFEPSGAAAPAAGAASEIGGTSGPDGLPVRGAVVGAVSLAPSRLQPEHGSKAGIDVRSGGTGSSEVGSGKISGAWSRAAKAMREGDDARATAALGELASSTDPVTRDAALLAQAQLDVARGRHGVAASRLRALSESGATALMRRRAREVLASMSEQR